MSKEVENRPRTRLSPIGWVALIIIVIVIAYGLLYAYRAFFPPVIQ